MGRCWCFKSLNVSSKPGLKEVTKMDRQRTRARPRTSLTAPVVAFGGFHVCLNLKVQVQGSALDLNLNLT